MTTARPMQFTAVLSRTVRMAWPTDRAEGSGLFDALPPLVDPARSVEWTVQCRGKPDHTGYLVSITPIDAAVRAWASTWHAAIESTECMRSLAAACAAAELPPLAGLSLRVSPQHAYYWDPAMPERLQLQLSFEFAASHRLALPGCSDAENQALFGKCSNPNGHGHNYRLDVTVTPHPSVPNTVATLETVVDREVMSRLDHKHLNLDCPEFADLNPSVEHIALVCRNLLQAPLRTAGLDLVSVTVWETAKTCATVQAAS
ncbi:MAG: 6-carboxytetrahydropterin synthase [Planctomycetes bacterium]|nr:6-carboxytetrahydropterin synthase [Planctomycetota bacterium]